MNAETQREGLDRRWLWRGLAVVAILLNGALACHFVRLWVQMERKDIFYRADFTPFYTAWTIMLKGEGPSLYDARVQFRVQQEVLAREGKSFTHLNGVANPPHTLLPLTWLALLPRDTAYKLWVLVLVGLHSIALVWCMRLFPAWGRLERWVLVLAYAGFFPVFWGVAQGAFSAVGVLATVGGWAVLAGNGSAPWSGFWLAATTVKPQMLVGPLCFHLGRRSWGPLTVFAVLSVVMAIVATICFGVSVWGSNAAYIRELALEKDIRCVAAVSMINLRGVLTVWMGETSVLANRIAAIMAPVGCLVAIVLGWSGGGKRGLRYALAVLLCLFLAPHLTIQDAALLLMPACLLYDHLRESGETVSRRWLATTLALAPTVALVVQPGVDLSAKARGPTLILLILLVWVTSRYSGASRVASDSDDAGDSELSAR